LRQPNLLRPLRMSYDASAGRGDRLPLLCVSSCGTPSWKRLECQDALRVAVVPCTSAIRALLAVSFGHHPAHNFLLKRSCCRFAQVIGITSDLRITFPYLLKICASKLGLWAPAGSRTATASLDVPPSSSASASRSNPRRARRTVVAPPLAISSIGAFRTPAVGACG
jgi:hypothetical protein